MVFLLQLPLYGNEMSCLLKPNNTKFYTVLRIEQPYCYAISFLYVDFEVASTLFIDKKGNKG